MRFKHASSEEPFGVDITHDVKISILKIIWEVWVILLFVVKLKLIFRKQLCSFLLLRGSQQMYIVYACQNARKD